MHVETIDNKEIWEEFLAQCKEKTFLQSFNWGEFQKKSGNKVWRLGIYVKNELQGIAQVIKVSAKRGEFLLVPHGPIIRNQKLNIKNQNSSIFKNLLEKLKEIGKNEKVSFIRIAPIWERTEENKMIFKELGFRIAPIHIHPEVTWQLNLEKSDEELLMDMRKTTRYLIGQGLKNKDLQIEKSKDPKLAEIFNNLYQTTAERHQFIPFSLNYLKNEVSAFLPDNCPECIEGQILIFLAKYKKEYLASSIVIFWQGIAFYHQGASSQKHPKIPASYLLQWEAIKEAKERGCRIYNFWGIAEGDFKNKSHPWWGLSLFKMGFGGYRKEYIKTQDFPLSWRYWITFIFEKIRSKKRRFV